MFFRFGCVYCASYVDNVVRLSLVCLCFLFCVVCWYSSVAVLLLFF